MSIIVTFLLFGNNSNETKVITMPRYRPGQSSIENLKFIYPRSELLDTQSPKSEPNLPAEPRSVVRSKFVKPFNLLQSSRFSRLNPSIREPINPIPSIKIIAQCVLFNDYSTVFTENGENDCFSKIAPAFIRVIAFSLILFVCFFFS